MLDWSACLQKSLNAIVIDVTIDVKLTLVATNLAMNY